MNRLAKGKLDYPGPQPAPRASMIRGRVRSIVAPELPDATRMTVRRVLLVDMVVLFGSYAKGTATEQSSGNANRL